MAVYRPDPILLERQIRSLQAQTVARWTCLVAVDGPDEAAHQLVSDLVADDPRFELHRFDENVGVYRHFERLLELVPATVEWVSLSDQDDLWYPDKFECLLPLFRDPEVMAVTGQARVVHSSGEVLGRTDREPSGLVETILRNQLTGSLAVVRRDVLDTATPFPPAPSYAIHDHWLAVCAAAVGRIALLDAVVQDYVQHPANVIGERPEGLRAAARQLSGFLRHPLEFIDDVALNHWAWRVVMAESISARIPASGRSSAVRAVSQGRWSVPLAASVVGRALRRRLSMPAALGFMAAAVRWPRLRRRAS